MKWTRKQALVWGSYVVGTVCGLIGHECWQQWRIGGAESSVLAHLWGIVALAVLFFGNVVPRYADRA